MKCTCCSSIIQTSEGIYILQYRICSIKCLNKMLPNLDSIKALYIK